jgi:uncharacterized protein YndB with AHSA1/START domain
MTEQTAEPVVKEVTIDAPVAKVWEAITDRNKMKEWYFDMDEFKPEVGFEFRFYGDDKEGNKNEYLHICVIKEVIPGKKLVHTWRYDGYPGVSYVTWELFPEGRSTKVVLTHTGLETFQAPEFSRSNFEAGWNYIVSTSLKEYLERI